MTNLLALLEAHQSTRLLRLSFPRNDGPHAKLMVNRFEGTEYLSRDFDFTVELLSDNARIELEAMQGKLAHTGNWDNPKARPMRTKVHGYILTKDTCMAVGVAKNNLNLGNGGATQYFIENKDKPNLVDTGRIMAYRT